MRVAAELDEDVNPYSIRHTVARRMRQNGVPAWEVAAQLGHKSRDYRTTELDAGFDPAAPQTGYCSPSPDIAAVVLSRIRRVTLRSLARMMQRASSFRTCRSLLAVPGATFFTEIIRLRMHVNRNPRLHAPSGLIGGAVGRRVGSPEG
jgi:hypothetical protein